MAILRFMVGADEADFPELQATYERARERLGESASLDQQAQEELFKQLKEGSSVYEITWLRHDSIFEVHGQHYVTDVYGPKESVNVTEDVLERTIRILEERQVRNDHLYCGPQEMYAVHVLKGVQEATPLPSLPSGQQPPSEDLTIVLQLGEIAPGHILLYANKRIIPGTDHSLDLFRLTGAIEWDTIDH